FCLRCLGAKPDALTQCWDVYAREGDRDYTQANPHNLCPVFTQEQLASSLRATYLLTPALCVVAIMDVEQLHLNILSALPSDPVVSHHLSSSEDPSWSYGSNGLLHLDNRIYVPEANDLCLCVLHYKHDHPLSGHFGQ